MNRSLTRFALTLIAATAFIVMLGGCVQMKSETVIDSNGGGTASMIVSMSTAVSEALVEMQAIDPEGAKNSDMPSFADLDKGVIEKRVKDFGVKITKFDKSTVDGRETITIAYEFKDMKGLSAAMSAVMGGESKEEGNGLGIFDAGDGNLVLRPTTYDFPVWEDDAAKETEAAAEHPAAETDPAQMQKQMELMGKLMGAMGELDVSMKITVPGDLVSTNAPMQEGRTSIWTINPSNMMTAGENMEPEIVFSGKGLKIKPQDK